MLNKKILFGAILSMAVCFSACSNGGTDITETNSETFAENASVTASESVPTEESETSDDNGGEEDDLTSPLTADPVSAVKAYLQELSENESVTSAELRDTSIGQTNSVADKYYESPLAEEFGVDEDTMLVPVLVNYYIEYADCAVGNGEKSEYFLVKLSENGFEVIDIFAYDPKEYYGEVKEVLTDEDGEVRFYMVELDDGLGTVKCNNAVIFSNDRKEVGERVMIHGNGGIYGDPPRIDAVSILSESELSD